MRKFKKLVKVITARNLRKDATITEQVLWKCLRDKKFFNKKFRRQHIIKGFILDFYCFEDRLGIELDGKIHLKQKEYDALRQKVLKDFGINILRFKNEEVVNNIDEVLNRIKNNLSLSIFNGEGLGT